MKQTALCFPTPDNAAFLLAVVLAVSCQGVMATTDQSKPLQDKKTAVTTRAIYPHRALVEIFSGHVVTRSGKPIAKATVEVAGRTALTDDKGAFRIAVVGSRPGSRYVLNIRKEGFGLVSKVYFGGTRDRWSMPDATTVSVDPRVANTVINARGLKACNGTLSSQVQWERYANRRTPVRIDALGRYVGPASDEVKGAVAFAETASVCNGGVAVTIPANALVDDRGYSPASNVSVSVSTVDVYEPGAMPGDDSAVAGGQSGYMVTYGAGSVTVSSEGKPLQIKKGSVATLTIPVNAVQLKHSKSLPKSIPFLLYDERDGVWHRVGEAKFDAQKNAYVASVTHLSAFNMDLVKTDQSCVRIESSAVGDDYQLEVSFVYGGTNIVKTVTVDNTPEKLHAIYNLPSNTDIALRAFRPLGAGFSVIIDTVSVNTGPPQNPGTPNAPVYPYSACNSQAVLTEVSLSPALYGPSTSTGSFTVSWDYTWPAGPGSSQDGFELEESTTSEVSGFSVPAIYSSRNTGDHRSHVDYSVPTRATGNYWYRVRAFSYGVPSPYSNVIQVQVNAATTTPTPRTLRIINDLDNRNIGGIDWNQLNGIIRVRVGTTCSDVIGGSGEKLFPGETTINEADLQLIPPAYGVTTSFKDFDVSGVSLASDNTYCVYLQAGYWDSIFDTTTYAFLYYEKHDTSVLNCSGTAVFGNKWVAVVIIQPFLEPEPIRASDYLPQYSWLGSPACP